MRLTRNWRLLVAFLLAGCLSSCSSSSSGGGGGSTAVAKGMVTDSTGLALAGATVQCGAASTISGADGSYALTLNPGAGLKVQASHAGRVPTFQVVALAAGQTMPVDFALAAVGQHSSLTSLLTTPATVTDARGATVALAANTLVDSNGAAVDAAAVDLTTALPSDAKFAATFPGLFIGTKTGTDAALQSFGFVTIAVTSGAGLACNLKPGATAGLAIPVAPGADPGTATIDLWSLDEATGKWTFVVAATRDAGAAPTVYRATVTHFSTYNLDSPVSPALPFTVTVKDAGGDLVAGAGVTATSTSQSNGAVWQGHATTAADGTCFFPSIPPGAVTVTALSGARVGNAYHYDVNNGAASLTIVVYGVVTRTFTLVYLHNGVQTPLAGVPASVATALDSPNAPPFAHGTTNANGQVALTLKDGLPLYTYAAHVTVGGQAYAISAGATTVAGIPATWLLQ